MWRVDLADWARVSWCGRRWGIVGQERISLSLSLSLSLCGLCLHAHLDPPPLLCVSPLRWLPSAPVAVHSCVQEGGEYGCGDEEDETGDDEQGGGGSGTGADEGKKPKSGSSQQEEEGDVVNSTRMQQQEAPAARLMQMQDALPARVSRR